MVEISIISFLLLKKYFFEKSCKCEFDLYAFLIFALSSNWYKPK